MTDLAFSRLLQTAGLRLANSTEIYPGLHKTGDAGLPLLLVENKLGRATIALQGAHVMSFQPKGQREMLWLSPQCVLEEAKPIRGGIPLCVPWFGAIQDGGLLHGFGRVMAWRLVAAEAEANGATRLVLELAGDAAVSSLWPHDFRFQLEVVVGSELKLALRAENRSATAAPFAFAFHSYFAVPNVAEARVTGLEGKTYIDKTDQLARKVQMGEVTIEALTDRIYLDVAPEQWLRTAAGGLRIESDSQCAVVWNCWENDAKMADIGAGNHVGYICVERCDVAERAVTLAAGDEYKIRMQLAFE